MKRLKFTLIALSVLFIVACSKKDNTPSSNASQNIIGMWKVTGTTTKFYDANNNVLASLHDPYNLIGTYNKFSSTYYYDYSGDEPDSAQYTFNTSVNPMVITVGGDFNSTIYISSLSNSQMICQMDETSTTYPDPATGMWSLKADHAISLDTLIKQ